MFESFKHYGIFLLIAAFLGTVLLSQKGGINVLLHPDLSALMTTQKIYCKGVVNQTCQVRLTTVVGDPEQYRDILNLLDTANSGDRIDFYLIGNGGQVRTEVQLLNAIKTTKAKVVMHVQGDVFSAHAALALTGDELKVGKYVLFLFHRSSAYGSVDQYCEGSKGKLDRTKDAYKKCVEFLNMSLVQDEAEVRELLSKVLTPDEIKRVLDGDNVILTGEVVQERLKKNGFRPR